MTRNDVPSKIRRIARLRPTQSGRNNAQGRGSDVIMTTDGRIRSAHDLLGDAALRVGSFDLLR